MGSLEKKMHLVDMSSLSIPFHAKYGVSQLYSDQSYNMFSESNRFEVTDVVDLDELDAATSDSSEPDLLWRFDNNKLPTLSNGNMLKSKKLDEKPTRTPELSKSMIPTLCPTPSRKLPNGKQKNAQHQLHSAEAKRRAGSRT